MEIFREQILKYIKRSEYTPCKLSSMAKSLGVQDRDYPKFKAAFEELCHTGKCVLTAKKLVELPPMPDMVIGTFRANARGFGFVIPDNPNTNGDLFIPPGQTALAMTGDKVQAVPFKKGVRSGQMRYNGTIVKIIERAQQQIVGTLTKPADEWIVRPDGKDYVEPVAVDDVTAKGAKEGDKVIVDIISYPTETAPGRGVILKVFGKSGLYDTEIESIIAQYRLPFEFDPECIAQAKEVSVNFVPEADQSHDDITAEVTITIDPPDAKDFDDAISLRKNEDGNWVLGVHIADVSTFIPMNSPLDMESKERGNSTYLPAKVIPMLPEVLSNGICSLQPNQKRYAKTAYMTYDKKGNLLGTEFANSLICSNARLTYLDADRIIKGSAEGFAGEVVALLKDMESLARAIEKRRQKNGMLHLDLLETELVLDDQGKVIDAQPADDSYPHTMIEMFMVEANEAVASLMDRFNIPFMRRIHPAPEPAGLKSLSRFIKLCGMKIPRHLDRKTIQDLLAAVKGTPQEYAVNIHILKSLQRAEYSPMHVGHFALASNHYCHFTSPIRRYADLTVHRLLQCYLEHHINMIGLEEVLPNGELLEIGNHITYTEQRSADAENELKTVLILQMLSEHIGMELNCVVSGLTNFGIFVQCTKYGIEGMIEFGDLGMDEWKYDDYAQAVVGVHSGKSVHLGQPMTVRIVEVNVPGRLLTLAPKKILVNSRQKFNTPKHRKIAKRRKQQRKKQHR